MATEGMAILSEAMEPGQGPELGHRLPQVNHHHDQDDDHDHDQDYDHDDHQGDYREYDKNFKHAFPSITTDSFMANDHHKRMGKGN